MKNLFALMCIAATTTYAPPASACSCALDTPFADRVASASAIFTAEVLGKSAVACNGQQVTYRVRVLEAWKGDATGEVTLLTSGDSASCGIDLSVGESYLIWAHGERNIGLCSGITTVANATEDIAQLRQQ